MTDRLVVHEIYLSIQGESTLAGWPCVFVRLTACNLRCSYCDTAYAFGGGQSMAVADVLQRVETLARPYRPALPGTNLPLVELTGGEPLLQPAVLQLMEALCQRGHTVLLETSGALDIQWVDPRVRRIVDLKCPSSGETGRILWSNLDHLRPADEIKFVVATEEDYLWTRDQIRDRDLARRCPLLVSWASPLLPHQRDPSLNPMPRDHTLISRRELVERLVADALPVRFQLQLHKHVWPPDQVGV